MLNHLPHVSQLQIDTVCLFILFVKITPFLEMELFYFFGMVCIISEAVKYIFVKDT